MPKKSNEPIPAMLVETQLLIAERLLGKFTQKEKTAFYIGWLTGVAMIYGANQK